MGSYYAGMMGYKDGDLRHFGILGQKWGIRRFQNKDGTLTPEGRERYYGADAAKGREEMSKLAGTYGDQAAKKLRNSPPVQDAAVQLRSKAKEVIAAEQDMTNAEYAIHKKLQNKDIYEKVLDRAVKDALEHDPNWFGGADIEQVKDMYRHDDFDQNEYGTFETYRRMAKDDPDVKKYNDAERRSVEADKALYDDAGSRSGEILGEHASDRTVNPLGRNGLSKGDRLKYMISDEAKQKYLKNNEDGYGGKTLSRDVDFMKQRAQFKHDLDVWEGKKFNDFFYKNIMAESDKIANEYQQEVARERKRIQQKVADADPDYAKDVVKEELSTLAEKYRDRFEKAVVKEMGYNSNDEETLDFLRYNYLIPSMGGTNALYP